MLELIWGVKTQAMLDVWSIEHVLSGLSVGHGIKQLNDRIFASNLNTAPPPPLTRYFDIIGVLFLAYLWETIEHYLEVGTVGAGVEYWFQGVEYWPNRVIFDPLLLILGYLIIRARPGLVTPARIASLIWLVVHIVVFPHSMYLHQLH